VNTYCYTQKELHVPVFDVIACALIIAAGMLQYQHYNDEI
jgi:hypothetical protein